MLKKLKVYACGDIGCYTLAAQPPLNALQTCLCMGAGIGQSFGMEKALGKDAKVVAVIGDSTFFHSGITPLADIVYNRGRSTIIILDNLTTAMTGRQGHPGSGLDIYGRPSPVVALEKLVLGLGVKRMKVVDPNDLEQVEQAVTEELEAEEPSVIIARSPCVLIPQFKSIRKSPVGVDLEKCDGCKICLQLMCPAMTWVSKTEPGKKRKGYAMIDPLQCTGCEVCLQVCKEAAIGREDKN